jgi:hypothetical protein
VDDLATLLAVEDIKKLKARYFRHLDAKDWASFETLFAPDAVMDMTGETGDPASVIVGAAAIAAFVGGSVEGVVTVHHGHMPEIDVTSPTTAAGVWAMEDLLRWEGDNPLGLRSLHGFGHYHETYRCEGGRWLIASLTLTRLRRDIETA